MSTVEALESAAGNTHLNVWNPAFPNAGSTSVSVVQRTYVQRPVWTLSLYMGPLA